MDIFGALTALQQTIDLTKSFRNIDEKIDAAVWKDRISDLTDKLIDTKDALIAARDRERELQDQINTLKAELAERGKYKDRYGLLWELDENQNEVGEPFCNQCFVEKDTLFRLQFGPYIGGSHKCNNCQGVFGPRSVSEPGEPLVRIRRTGWDDLI
jgi:hypothetical protein